jgi:hypothetical protein
MRLYLEVIDGKYAAQTIALEEGDVCRVGRGAKAELCLPDDFALSETHFALGFDGFNGRLFDWGSANGTFCNGERISAANLETNTRISAGNTNFAVFLEEELSEKTFNTPLARLVTFLHSQPQRLFCLLDAARDKKILPLLEEYTPNFQSLYQGEAQAQLANVAPYLVVLGEDDDFLEILLRCGWGKRWLSFFTSTASLTDLRSHFRKFIFVKDERGETLYFRFYDPGILSAFLTACNAGELGHFFGGIESFFIEGSENSMLTSFHLVEGTANLQYEESSLC